MSQLDERGRTLENKYAHDQDTLFRIEARACKLLGLWAALEMGMEGDAASTYAGDLVAHNLKEPGLGDIRAKVAADMAAKGKSTDTLDAMLLQFIKDAEAQIKTA